MGAGGKRRMRIRLTQLDGKLPNLALMKLAHYHRARGDDVWLTYKIERGLFEPQYDTVLGSQIFSFTAEKARKFQQYWPEAIIRGTGTGNYETVESYLGIGDYELYDYSDYPKFQPSMGFSQRGCRLSCKFCVVPKKEGKVKESNTIAAIWRGEPHPRQIILLDNDFFGQPNWEARAQEILDGGFEVSFNQGINVRLIHEPGAAYLAQMKYRDDGFKTKRIYTAWDNRKDEGVFFRGIEILLKAGIRPQHIMVYMLCGYWPGETFDDVYHRYERIKAAGLLPYPMIYDRTNKTLTRFQRWVIRRYYTFIEWKDYGNKHHAADEAQEVLEFAV